MNRLFAALEGTKARLALPESSLAEFEAAYTMRFIAAVSGMSEDELRALEKDLNALPAERDAV